MTQAQTDIALAVVAVVVVVVELVEEELAVAEELAVEMVAIPVNSGTLPSQVIIKSGYFKVCLTCTAASLMRVLHVVGIPITPPTIIMPPRLPPIGILKCLPKCLPIILWY